MKKIVTRLLVCSLFAMVFTSPVPAASLPIVPTRTATSEPDPEVVKSALNEFKNLSRSERRGRMKEAKKLFKEYKAAKRAHREDAETNQILLAILAIFLPPLAVYLKDGELDVKFWIDLALVFLVFFSFVLWIIPVVFALLVVFDVI